MRLMNRIVIIPAVAAVCAMATGCFSYHKHVDETSSPAPVVEAAPPSTTVVTPAPPETSSTTTTTTDNGVVERQKTTTYTAP
jgi:hypothetical protein